MRKKSHISLAKYLVQSLEIEELYNHKKAFYIGSILPDCKPSFLTTKHEIRGTLPMVQASICNLVEENKKTMFTSGFYRSLGEVMHYLADYFTFPHNSTFLGNIREHCAYEQQLKISLREYIKSGEAEKNLDRTDKFHTLEELFAFIRRKHEEYLQFKRTVEEDCKYIVSLCHSVAAGIFSLMCRQQERAVVA